MILPEEIYGLEDLRPGDVGFGPIHGRVGAGIKAALTIVDGNAPYQHTFMVVKAAERVGPDNRLVGPTAIEAMPHGALRVDIGNRWTRKYCYVRPDYETQEQAWGVAQSALALEGTPYSILDYGAIGLHEAHVPVPHLKAYIESSKHLICSQLVDKVLTDNDWHPFDDDRWPGFVTPSALFNEFDRRKPRLIFAYPN